MAQGVSPVSNKSQPVIAWEEGNMTQFQNCLSEELSPVNVDEIISEIVLKATDNEFQSSRFTFITIIFDYQLHRQPYRGHPLFVPILQRGLSKVLECLLEYTPNLRAVGEALNSPLHILCDQKWNERDQPLSSFQKCMELLLKCDEIDINALNNNMRTPLDLAIGRGNNEAVEMLLQSSKPIYVDRDVPNDSTTRIRTPEQLRKYLPDANDPAGKKAAATSLLLFFLRNTSANKGRFITDFPVFMRDIDLLEQLTAKLNIFLQEACLWDAVEEVQLLMNYGADPSFVDKWNDSHSAITIAIEKGHLTIFSLLLQRASVIHLKLDDRKKNQSNINFQNKADGNTALHYAVQYGNDDAMLEILKMGGCLGVENKKKEIPLTKIPRNIMEKFLDSQLKQVKNDSSSAVFLDNGNVAHSMSIKQFGYNREKFNFDCRFLTYPHSSPQKVQVAGQPPSSPDAGDQQQSVHMKLLKKMIEVTELRPLIIHPVLRSFILKKWQIMQVLYYINLILMVLLTLSLTFYVLWTAIKGEEPTDLTYTIRGIQGVFLLIQAILDVLQVLILGIRHFIRVEKFLELAIIIIGAYLSIVGSNGSDESHQLGAFVILASWMAVFLFLGKHPWFSVQVEMFRLVLWTFVKFFSVYLILIIAFALSFFVLFTQGDGDYVSVWQAIFRTLIMVSGEFDLTDENFDVHSGSSHVIFVAFIFLVAIVLLNLLNGLAVYDTNVIKKDALLHSYVSRVRFLASLEEVLSGVQSWVVFKKMANHFLKFEFQIVDSEEVLYKMDSDILKAARNVALENAKEKDLLKVAQKKLSDHDKRSETDDKLFKVINVLSEKINRLEIALNENSEDIVVHL